MVYSLPKGCLSCRKGWRAHVRRMWKPVCMHMHAVALMAAHITEEFFWSGLAQEHCPYAGSFALEGIHNNHSRTSELLCCQNVVVGVVMLCAAWRLCPLAFKSPGKQCTCRHHTSHQYMLHESP